MTRRAFVRKKGGRMAPLLKVTQREDQSAAKGSRAMLRARLMASTSSRWWTAEGDRPRRGFKAPVEP